MTAPVDLETIEAQLDDGERICGDDIRAIIARCRAAEAEVARLRERVEMADKAIDSAAETLEAIGEPVNGSAPRATLRICEHLARSAATRAREALAKVRP